MNKAIIISELNSLLEAINEQFEIIKEPRERIPQMEFDILMENVRKLLQKLELLQKMMDIPSSAQPGMSSTIQKEPAQKKEKEKIQQKPRHPVPKVARPDEPELFPGEEQSFSTRLKEARKQSLGPKIPVAPDHLKNFIGITDKFLFVNDLFDGSLKEYNETIETLNNSPDARSAYDYLDRLLKKNLWNPGSEGFRKLKEIVESRFRWR